MPKMWVTQVEIEPLRGCNHGGIEGAYVNVVIPAASAADAAEAARLLFQARGFRVVGHDAVEDVRHVLRTHEVGEELGRLIRRARRFRKPQFGSLYTWRESGGPADDDADVPPR